MWHLCCVHHMISDDFAIQLINIDFSPLILGPGSRIMHMCMWAADLSQQLHSLRRHYGIDKVVNLLRCWSSTLASRMQRTSFRLSAVQNATSLWVHVTSMHLPSQNRKVTIARQAWQDNKLIIIYRKTASLYQLHRIHINCANRCATCLLVGCTLICDTYVPCMRMPLAGHLPSNDQMRMSCR